MTDVSIIKYTEPYNLLDLDPQSIWRWRPEVEDTEVRYSSNLLRSYFLDGITKYQAHLIDELADKHFTFFCKLGLGDDSYIFNRSLRSLNILSGVIQSIVKSLPKNQRIYFLARFSEPDFEKYKKLHTRIKRWLRAHALDAEWVFDAIYKTFESWARNPYARLSVKEVDELSASGTLYTPSVSGAPVISNKQWSKQSYSYPRIGDKLPPPAGMPAYLPEMESRDEYINKIDNLIDEVLSNTLLSHNTTKLKSFCSGVRQEIREIAMKYCKQAESYIITTYDVEPTKKKKNLHRDIEWTVLYQVKNMTSTDIALQYNQSQRRKEKVSHRAVDNAVKRILRAIDLPPRP